jgi:3-carboxy-cis,cis-muconate cycloisomerase
MARFEGALAKASVGAGWCRPRGAKPSPRSRRGEVRCRRDRQAARRSATLAVPFVKSLTEQVAAVSADAARYVHLGATSQDVVDTGVVLCLGPACARVLSCRKRVGDAAAALASAMRKRRWSRVRCCSPRCRLLFGWKAAVWLSASRARMRVFAAAAQARKLQFGGAGGTLSSFGAHGEAIADALPRSSASRARRSPGTACVTLRAPGCRGGDPRRRAGKIARDVSLLMQPEVGEVAEPSGAGRGGSSAMPHKRNPVGCVAALEAAQRAPHLAAALLRSWRPSTSAGLDTGKASGSRCATCFAAPPARSPRWPRCWRT